MGFLERSKVTLTCRLAAPAAVVAGGRLSGSVLLRVKEPVSFASLRVHVTGREHVEAIVQRGTLAVSVCDSLPYLDVWLTLSGADDLRARELQTFSPGTYTFPFALDLPRELPPSYSLDTGSGTAEMEYLATAVLEIPNGFDATSAAPFRVRSAAPAAQARELRDGCPAVQGRARVYERGCLCCFWGREGDVTVRATAAPGLLVLAPGAGRTAEVSVALSLHNASETEEVPAVRARLVNVATLRYDLHESQHRVVVAEGAVPSLSAPPGGDGEGRVTMPLLAAGLRTSCREPARLPLPSLHTAVVDSCYVLEVHLCGVRCETRPALMHVVYVAGDAGGSDDVPRVPACCPRLASRARVTRYVQPVDPSAVQFPTEAIFEEGDGYEYQRRSEHCSCGPGACDCEPAGYTVVQDGGGGEEEAGEEASEAPSAATTPRSHYPDHHDAGDDDPNTVQGTVVINGSQQPAFVAHAVSLR